MDNTSFLSFLSVPLILKIFMLVLTGGFTIFCLVVLNQVRIMNKIVDFGSTTSVLFVISVIFLIVSFSLFLLSIAIL